MELHLAPALPYIAHVVGVLEIGVTSFGMVCQPDACTRLTFWLFMDVYHVYINIRYIHVLCRALTVLMYSTTNYRGWRRKSFVTTTDTVAPRRSQTPILDPAGRTNMECWSI